MNKNATVFLPIEVKRRELDSKLLLAIHLIKAGIPVIIGDRMGCARELMFVENSLYLAKSLSVDLAPVFNEIKTKNGKILVLFEEGGLVAKENDKFEEIISFYPPQMLPYVDTVLTYGQNYQDLIIDNVKLLNKENTFVVGNTRFDLHKPKFSSLYDDRVKAIKKKYGKFILINTNFSFANHVCGEDYIINELKNNKDFSQTLINKYIERVNLKKQNIKEFVAMMKKVATEFSDYTILVRPHPGEKVELYINELKEYKNISVTNKDIATPWIIACDILIHQDCTTGIESYLAGKPVISYLPSDDPNLSWLSVFISEKAKSEDELIKKINYYITEKNKFVLNNEQQNVLYNEIVNTEKETGPLMIQKINELINEFENTPKNNSNLYKLFLNKFYRRNRMFLWWYKNKYITKHIYSMNFEGLSKNEIYLLIEKLIKIENLDLKYTIKQKGINTFLLERKN
jgi:surface carbohydrate biosynthesis protein